MKRLALSQRLSGLVSAENKRAAMVVVVWTIAVVSIFVQALFQRAYLTPFDHLLVAATCVVAGAILSDFAKALLGFFAAMILSLAIILTIVLVPISGDPAITSLFQLIWIPQILLQAFPFPWIAYLISSMAGSFIGEKYFE